MGGRHELTGQAFGRLTVQRLASSQRSGRRWLCRCECGNETEVWSNNLISGNTQSCGCLHKEVASDLLRTHGWCGEKKRPEYKIWVEMIRRCTKEDHPAFKSYGARGITVSDEWRSGDGVIGGFEYFIRDMGPRPTSKHSLDRRNNDEGYNRDNCRWAVSQQQNRNRRDNVFVEWQGRRVLLRWLCETRGLKFDPVRMRMRKGMPLEEALSKPLQPVRGPRKRLSA
ncbi:hypothetical protein [Methylobacterium radiotolerans]|uniref:hypothetical protein n=1 Tax=Methylobacterium radiotolerans TaxID=31998 RepID=UPI0038D10CB8